MKKLSKKLSLCYKTVSKGGMLEYLNDESIKDPIIQLLNKKEEVEIILKSHKENKFRFYILIGKLFTINYIQKNQSI